MNTIPDLTKIKQEDIMKFLIKYLQEGGNKDTSISNYGYDLYLPHAIRQWISEHKDLFNIQDNFGGHFKNDQYLPMVSKSFYDPAWELCRRGILRPGISGYSQQSTDDGSAGNGYSITSFGKIWLQESDKDIFIPTEPERFGEMISPFSKLFGDGFQQRSQEAIRCYGAHAYLACCVMSGAAAESILLHLAITKSGDEEQTMKDYESRNGTSKIRNQLIGKSTHPIQKSFEIIFDLLKYWRDESAHGKATQINDNEAYTSLSMLLRIAQFSKDNFNDLTS